jgi:Ca2+-transporting ATPase
MDIQDIYSILKTGPSGLTPEEANARLQSHGPNELRRAAKISPVSVFLGQFNNFLIYLLILAAAISAAIGEVIDALIIAAIMVLNAVLGFVQEYKSEQSIEALQKYIVQEAYAIRDGHKIRLHASQLVPGDIIEVEAGENIPADARIIEASRLKVDESPLTGESEPASKHGGVLPQDQALADMDNMLFNGTEAIDGRARAIVIATGMDTEIGRIASLVASGVERETPMQVSVNRLGKTFGIAAVICCIIVFGTGLVEGNPLYDMFLVAVSLAVAAIPEGLPATITVALAVGVQRMAKRKAVVRRLSAVETLGSTNIICSDKTGTLTQNAIVLRSVVTADRSFGISGDGYSPDGKFNTGDIEVDPASDKSLKLLLIAGTLCNNAAYERLGDRWDVLGDSTEVALLVAAAKAGLNKTLLEDKCPRLLEMPFNTNTKRMSTVNVCDGTNFVFTKGAPELLIDKCDFILYQGEIEPFDEELKGYFKSHNERMASQGMRVLGFAYRKLEGDPKKVSVEELEDDLAFIGLGAMIDPPRPEVKEAVKRCRDAGIDAVMITGDHPLTAVSIAKDLGIFRDGDLVITGAKLSEMSDAGLEGMIDRITVYARTSPEQKLRIVEAMQKRGRTVAMTGDGVNDAPALKRADIGVAMGKKGTDVARQAADLVLTDDNFSTIVAAVEEGRAIFENAGKVVKFYFATNMAEVLVIFLGILLGLPLPLLAIQILWMNLITDSLPGLVLSIDTPGRSLMEHPPRKRSQGLIGRIAMLDIILIGLTIAAGTLAIFYISLPNGVDYARTMAFTALVAFQMWTVLSCRSETESVFSFNTFNNPLIWLAIAISLILQCMILYVPYFGALFRTVALHYGDWLLILIATSVVMFVVEARKLLFKMLKVKGV